MDISQIQAMHAYIQQLNFQTASAVSSTTPNLFASPNPLLNPALINPPPPTSINDSSLNPLALAFLYANQHHQQNSSNTQVQQQQQPRIHSQQIPIPPATTTTTMPLNFQPQQQLQVATPQQQIYNPNNIQISDIQKQIEQQAILNQLSQLISSLGQSQIPPPSQIGSVYNPLPQQFHQQQQHQSAMSKPPILTPSQPIQIPKPQQQQLRQSLPTSTPESNRKRRHRDIEIISSQSSSQSSSPNNNNNINASRSRAFTCPETMKEKQQPSQKDQSDHPSSPDKIAKFDPSCPRRHHPDNLSPPNEEAMLLEQITTAYLLNSLGESAYKASNPKDENKSKQFGIESSSETNEKSGNIVKIPMSEIHRIIEDCFSE